MMSTDDGREPEVDEVQQAIRQAVDAWRMPAPSPGERTWQARIAAGRARGTGARSLLGPLWRAAGLAVALTVVAAVAVALLTSRPGPQAGTGGAPSPSPTPVASTLPPASTLPSMSAPPTVQAFGAPIAPRSLLVTGAQARLLAIPSGLLSPTLATFDETSSGTVVALPDGTYLCACAGLTTQGSHTTIRVTARIYDARGTLVRAFDAGSYAGAASDATDAQGAAATYATPSPDGRTLFVGYATQGAAGWQRGIAVYDMATGTRTQEVSLGGVPLRAAGASPAPPAYASPPVLTVSPGGQHVLVSATVVANNQEVAQAWWSAAVSGGRLGPLTAFPAAAGTLSAPDCPGYGYGPGGPIGFASDSIFVVQCDTGTRTFLSRVTVSGQPLGDVALPADFGGSGPTGMLLDQATGTYFGWDPFSGRLVRVDVARGTVTGSVLLPKQTTAAAGGLLAQLGRRVAGWVAPDALAKTYLAPSIALSPDGRRVYLIGTTGTSFASVAGSSGVLVVDSRSLQVVARWAPTADYDSLAVSRDGSLVYVLSMPGVDASGSQGDTQASLTVFDAASGSVRLSVENLGADFVQFPGATQP